MLAAKSVRSLQRVHSGGSVVVGKAKAQADLIQMVSLEQWVPTNSILRRIDAAVGLSFIRRQVRDKYRAGSGRLYIDPQLTLRLYTPPYLFNLSERAVYAETQTHGGFRWFWRLGFLDPAPDHSTLVKTRRPCGRQTFKAVLAHLVNHCIGAGLAGARKAGDRDFDG